MIVRAASSGEAQIRRDVGPETVGPAVLWSGPRLKQRKQLDAIRPLDPEPFVGVSHFQVFALRALLGGVGLYACVIRTRIQE